MFSFILPNISLTSRQFPAISPTSVKLPDIFRFFV